MSPLLSKDNVFLLIESFFYRKRIKKNSQDKNNISKGKARGSEDDKVWHIKYLNISDFNSARDVIILLTLYPSKDKLRAKSSGVLF